MCEILLRNMHIPNGIKLSVVGIITPDLRCYTVITDNKYNPIQIIEAGPYAHIAESLSGRENLDNLFIPYNRKHW